MPSSSKLCQIGLLGALALAVAAAPAFAQDADAKTKKTTQQQKKVEKPKSNSAMDKDTTSNYPPQSIPGSGY
jgi:hypothetical protein